ncbi:winged helix DNA-binding domain-containing protein [Dactylosporangium sp. AC04546]|uniref:winged helix DNA-binding domain-containing protein n=1 Tax=Dactylosporangium sp. AC04546 TaxID=2862460 RepID=UPI001EDF1E3B|nr:winged helix DNA-binding domain-containing protein [Dactylosporangium sp. AC04546]WVK82151.1 winged helix DNA-binding domain-containing protein [Dactylosporangium sp. AC04546]
MSLRLAAQLLAGPPAATVAAAVERVVGVQAQSMPAARLAVRARTAGLVAADADRSLTAGETVRTWLMRNTLHLVTAADHGWLHALFAPLNLAAGRRRREQLGLDGETCVRALAAVEAVVAGGPVGRAELVRRVVERGVRIDPSGQAPAHLVAYAAMSGLVTRGPDLARGEPSVVAGPAVVPAFAGDEALGELARRYLLGYGPAGPADLAAWSGLPSAAARRAFEVLGDGAPEPGAVPEVPAVRLLGAFDPVLLGHRDRSFVLAPEHARLVNAGGGMVGATILAEGRVAGLWRRAGRRVALEPFAPLPAGVRAAVPAEVADLGRFLGEGLE